MALRDRPIRQKLIIVTLMTSSLALLLMCGALVIYEVITFQRELIRNTEVIAGITASNTTGSLAFDVPEDAQQVLNAMAVEPHILAAAIYDKDGNRFAHYVSSGKPMDVPSTPGPLGHSFTPKYLQMFRPVVEDGKRVGTIYVAADLQPVYDKFWFYGILVVGVGACATLASLGLSIFLQRRISKPITELARVARSVSSEEDYSVRAVKHGNDEIGELTDAFNGMLTRIGESHSALEASEDRLLAAKDAAEAANAAKDNFLAILSHELRTPLTPVLATVAMLDEENTFPPHLRKELDTIRRNVEVEARLIDDLLDVTRISRGKLELHRQVVDARELLAHAMQNYCAPEAARKQLRVTTETTAEHVHVVGDASRLTQVCWNLLQNACKFTPEGGEIRIRIFNEPSASGGEPDLLIQVEDSGIGIEPAVLPRIFDAFEQGERSRTRMFGGLGLGLAISRALMELHGGTLTADSAGKDQGSTFTIRLQTTTAAPAAAPQPAAPPRVPGGQMPAPKKAHILLVEDHPDTASQLARLLGRLGHRVTLANTLTEARAAAAKCREPNGNVLLDLLVSDLGLPDGSGHELMRELSAQYHLPGIALSGYGMDADIRESLASGFSHHLTKPVDWDELKSVIAKCLNGQGSSQAV